MMNPKMQDILKEIEGLAKEGYKEINNLLYVEWSEEKGFYILTQDDVDNTIYRIDG